MSERRFTDKPELNPAAVWSLPDDHPAMVEKRTLFPSTVVTVTEDEPDRLLVSGKNNRKIGGTVEKGRFKGYAIYGLSLEERATCPSTCFARGYCYGNGMQLARRHRIGDPDVFFDRIGFELAELCQGEHAETGVLLRLHVLGDFPSVEYVAFWKDALDEYPNLACYGYTNCRLGDDESGEIAAAIMSVKSAHPERFRIRWSGQKVEDGAVVANFIPDKARIDGGLVCPAQTDKTACCATCALCWEAKHETIVFIKHGRVSTDAEAKTVMAAGDAAAESDAERDVAQDGAREELRAVVPINVSSLSPSAIRTGRPRFVDVQPEQLVVETKYQRDLSTKSMNLIRRIVERFDWAKFKPPVCVEHGNRYFVIDGQHTAIGAASHPDIKTIPVMVVDAESLEARAASFVAHNRDRVAMSPYQVFHGEVAAGEAEAVEINRIINECGAAIPRNPTGRRDAKFGHVTAVSAVQRLYRSHGEEALRKIIRTAVEAKCRPINSTVVHGLEILMLQPQYEDVRRSDIVTALIARPDLEQAAQRFAAETNQGRFTAAAVIIYRAASALSTRTAA